MILPGHIVLNIVVWIAERVGLKVDFLDHGIVGSLDEHEVSEQLHYGRE